MRDCSVRLGKTKGEIKLKTKKELEKGEMDNKSIIGTAIGPAASVALATFIAVSAVFCFAIIYQGMFSSLPPALRGAQIDQIAGCGVVVSVVLAVVAFAFAQQILGGRDDDLPKM